MQHKRPPLMGAHKRLFNLPMWMALFICTLLWAQPSSGEGIVGESAFRPDIGDSRASLEVSAGPAWSYSFAGELHYGMDIDEKLVLDSQINQTTTKTLYKQAVNQCCGENDKPFVPDGIGSLAMGCNTHIDNQQNNT